MAKLEFARVDHAYGRHAVVRDLDFALADGEIGCLLGASGCGKTTVLRLIAGFKAPTRGEIRLQDELIASPARQLPPEQRRIGMVFQDYALARRTHPTAGRCPPVSPQLPPPTTVARALGKFAVAGLIRRYGDNAAMEVDMSVE